MAYYAVKEGRVPGIYRSWDQAEKQVKSYSNAKYKKFKTREEALEFMGEALGEEVPSRIEAGDQAYIEDIEEFGLEENQAVSYVDGSFDLESFSYGYGVVFFIKGAKECFSGRDNREDLASMRNVSGELKGAMVAMEKALEYGKDELFLHYDYQGIEEWALGRWKTNKEGTKSYKAFYDSISSRLKVHFIKVKAHSGIKYNEEADRLAKESLS